MLITQQICATENYIDILKHECELQAFYSLLDTMYHLTSRNIEMKIEVCRLN